MQLYSCNGLQSLYYPRKTSHGGQSKGYGERSCVVLEQQGRIGGVREVQWGEDQVGFAISLSLCGRAVCESFLGKEGEKCV